MTPRSHDVFDAPRLGKGTTERRALQTEIFIMTKAKYTLPDLAYDYGALEPHLSGRILELHHGKHHKTYVEGANTVLEKLEQARATGDFGSINQLEKNLAFHLSGHILHSIFWKNLAPGAGGKPTGELADAVDDQFGSFDAFKAQLTEASNNVQGSGWGALSWEPVGQRLIVEQVYDHQGNVGQGGPPLLVLDMWEHAYYLQYENRKTEWVDAFWELVDWDDVATRFTSSRSIDLVLGT
jgi:superoxide dismutase, Fe-Mn family